MSSFTKRLLPDTTAMLTCCLFAVVLSSEEVVAASFSCTPKPDDIALSPLDSPTASNVTKSSRPTLSLPFETNHPISGSSDKMTVSEQQLNMIGNVYLKQTEWQVWADQLEHNFDTSATKLDGNVRLQSKTLNLGGKSAVIEQETGAYSITAPSYKYSQEDSTTFRGEADQARFENNTITADRGWITACPPGDKSWSIRARTIRLDETRNRGTARDLVFRLGRLPILYLPWLQFPTTEERQSGMLAPDLQLQGNGNPDLALPIYLNLAPNYDAIITPRIIFGRGLLTRVEFRHLSTAMQNEVHASLMPNDRDTFLSATNPTSRRNRWNIAWQHQGHWPGGFSTQIDYTQTSDRLYYRDFGNDREVIAQGELRQAAILKFHRRDWSASLLTQRFQVLDVGARTPYTVLPAFDFNWQPTRAGRLKWQLQAGFDNFDRNALADPNVQQATGKRLRATPRLAYQVGRRYGGVRLDGAFRYRRFNLNNNSGEQTRHEIGSGLLSLDAHLKLARYSKGKQRYVHFLEPRVFYLWSQYQDQSELPLFDTTTRPGKIRDLFIENLFTGFDRILDANRIVFSLANRWQSLTTGHQWVNLNVASFIRLKSERVGLGTTPDAAANDRFGSLQFELNVKPTPNIVLGGAWTHNLAADKTGKLTLSFGYRNGDRKIINFQYRDRQKRKRLLTSLYLPISKNLQFAAVWNRDIKTNTNLERIFGIEYFHCCWQLRIGWRSFPIGVDDFGRSAVDKGVFFHFTFRGLGQIRSSAADVYSSSIQGFREPGIWDTK